MVIPMASIESKRGKGDNVSSSTQTNVDVPGDHSRSINSTIASTGGTTETLASRESDNDSPICPTTAEVPTQTSTVIVRNPETQHQQLPLSKNRKKKLEKRERARQKKLERKAAEKAQRLADAIAQGRDLDAERKFVEERTKSGDRQRYLDEVWETKRTEASDRFEICIDLGGRNEEDGIRAVFEKAMREREVASLAQQIRYCYSYNRKSPNPVFSSVTGLTRARDIPIDILGSDFPTVRELLERETGFPEWNRRMFECTEQPLEEYYGLSVATNVSETVISETNQGTRQKTIVYLTSDSPNTLEHLENDAVYVIGGIVDRNRLKRATIDRAQDELKVETAKLPLQEYLLANNISMTTTKVLTVNHVFDILLKYRQHGDDWNKAFEIVLPSRKV